MKRSADILREIELEPIENQTLYAKRQVYDSGCDSTPVLAMSSACEQGGRRQTFVSGICELYTPDGNLDEITGRGMERLGVCLREAGLGFHDVALVHLYVQNMADFSRINNVYKRYFGSNPPVRFVAC